MTDTKAGRDPEGAVKEIEAQAQERSICPVCDGECTLDGRARGGTASGQYVAIDCPKCDGQGTVPAGPQGDLAAWQKKAGEFLREPEYSQNTATMAMVLRAHLAAMPQAQPDGELLKALKKLTHVTTGSDARIIAYAAIAQAEPGAAG